LNKRREGAFVMELAAGTRQLRQLLGVRYYYYYNYYC
jgi:hypothetical protein